MRRAALIATVLAGLGHEAVADDAPDAAIAEPGVATAAPADAPAAEPAGVTAAAPARETEGFAAAAVGAGSVGRSAAVSLELRAELVRPTFAVGIAPRLRLVGGSLAPRDWDQVGDWLAVLHHLEWQRHAATSDAATSDAATSDAAEPWRHRDGIAVAAGQLARIDLGAIADAYTAAIDADGRHAGVAARADLHGWSLEAALDDAAAPRLIAGRVARAMGPAVVGVEGGVDPARPTAMTRTHLAQLAADASVATRRGAVTSWLDAGAGFSTGPGVGAWLGAATEARTASVRARLRVEGTVGSGGWVPSPWGPLYRVMRVDAGAGGAAMAPDDARAPLIARARAGELGGAGGAASLVVEGRGASAEAAMRYRPGLGGEARGRVAIDVGGPVQAGAWLAAAPRLGQWAAAGEIRTLVGRFEGALEAARLYGTDALDAPAAVWQVTAWLGVRADL